MTRSTTHTLKSATTKRKRRGGKPPHEPTDETRERVKHMKVLGLQDVKIAALMGISRPTLYKHYRSELDHGADELDSRVAESLYDKARDDVS